jgi:hypothetical protein
MRVCDLPYSYGRKKDRMDGSATFDPIVGGIIFLWYFFKKMKGCSLNCVTTRPFFKGEEVVCHSYTRWTLMTYH